MNYEEIRADLDELAQEMTISTHAWSYSQRLGKLRSLAILSRRAMSAASGSLSESERRHGIECLLARIKGMVAATQLGPLKGGSPLVGVSAGTSADHGKNFSVDT